MTCCEALFIFIRVSMRLFVSGVSAFDKGHGAVNLTILIFGSMLLV